MEFVHIGLGSRQAKGIDKPLQVHGANLRQLHGQDIRRDFPGHQLDGIERVGADGVPLVGIQIDGNPFP